MRLQPLHFVSYHVTYLYGANFSHIFEIPDPDLPVQFTIQLLWRYDDV